MEINIYVCAHKKDYYRNDNLYLPIQVGCVNTELDLDILSDGTDDNISNKNNSFCELTALYWIWKNATKVDYIGLNHYRRYFDYNSNLFKNNLNITTEKNDLISYSCEKDKMSIFKYLDKNDIILSKKKFYPYSLFHDYAYCHISDDMRLLQNIIHELYPDYDDSFKKIIFQNNKLSPCNMFITRWEVFNNYCEWLFTILFEIEKRININNYNSIQKRIYGYMAERLLNVYVYHHSLKVKYLPITCITNDIANIPFIKHYLLNIKSNISFMLNCPKYIK